MKSFHLQDRVLVPTVAGELPGTVEDELEPGVFVIRLDDARLPRLFVLAQALRADRKARVDSGYLPFKSARR